MEPRSQPQALLGLAVFALLPLSCSQTVSEGPTAAAPEDGGAVNPDRGCTTILVDPAGRVSSERADPECDGTPNWCDASTYDSAGHLNSTYFDDHCDDTPEACTAWTYDAHIHVTADEAATCFSLTRQALRARCRRAARLEKGGRIVARLGPVVAWKLGNHWRFFFTDLAEAC